MRDLKVWMRVGDADEYHSFDSVDEAAEELAELWSALGYPPPQPNRIVRAKHSGVVGVDVTDSDLQGENAVSLYWGDDDANLETPLSDSELLHFNICVANA